MTKNIEDLLYRGDSLERMGEMSGRLREDSKKYRKAAVRINWELLLKQVRSQSCCITYLILTSCSAVWSDRRRWTSAAHPDLVAFLLNAKISPICFAIQSI
jgi:hypothetical protein